MVVTLCAFALVALAHYLYFFFHGLPPRPTGDDGTGVRISGKTICTCFNRVLDPEC